jgi:hypothetical protein
MNSLTLAVLGTVVVGLAAVLAVAWPLLGGAGIPEGTARSARADSDANDANELDEAIARSLAAIREIEFDYRAGNLSDEDFAALDRAERARAAELMRRRDRAPE